MKKEIELEVTATMRPEDLADQLTKDDIIEIIENMDENTEVIVKLCDHFQTSFAWAMFTRLPVKVLIEVGRDVNHDYPEDDIIKKLKHILNKIGEKTIEKEK